ncbi:hypothetical protein M413DRAFT_75109 [Hebeloma cylindrosporum]|uniref:Protein kinase domain-containing protein n=1 Tax=Hebeloma cylindrosporum TaxID=76867 RepID=A0A0C3BRH8_HEBCY|nr:hypothetical protein M413DRAFT_75109 [Hebeloma cylindrosporum h7]
MANVELRPGHKDLEELGFFEKYWVSIQPFLLSRGYELRSRYHPGWTPSWLQPGGKRIFSCDDSLPTVSQGSKMIDATRTNDGAKVVIRQVPTKTDELPILLLLSSPSLQADPRNCTVPILDIIILPGNDDTALIVMPMLRDFGNLTFRRVGEVVEMFEQVVHFLAFLHEQNISHMDFCWFNIMMDGSRVVPKGWHMANQFSHDGISIGEFEWVDRWSVRPVKYYVIDFELSQRMISKDNPRLFVGSWGQDRSVPEMSFTTPSDPFKVDVYQLGNVIKKLMTVSVLREPRFGVSLTRSKNYIGLDILKPLVDAMTNPDPLERLTAEESSKQFSIFRKKCSKRVMKGRIWRNEAPIPPLSSVERFFVKYLGYNPTN